MNLPLKRLAAEKVSTFSFLLQMGSQNNIICFFVTIVSKKNYLRYRNNLKKYRNESC